MRNLLIPLLTAFALPTAVNAESVWLIISHAASYGPEFATIEMKDINQCEKQGQLFLTTERLKLSKKLRGYECLRGK